MKHRSCVKRHYLNPGTCVFETCSHFWSVVPKHSKHQLTHQLLAQAGRVDRCRLEHTRQEVMEICSSDEEAGDPLLNQLNEVVAELSLPLGRIQQVTLKHVFFQL